MAARTVRTLIFSTTERAFAETFRHTPFQTCHLHPITFHYCYVITFKFEMSTSLFSLSAPVRLLLALVLVFLGAGRALGGGIAMIDE
jgi:hypothetical protein